MSIYTEVLSKLTAQTIHDMREEHIPYYKEVLANMENEFIFLDGSLACATKPGKVKILNSLWDKLESFYRKELMDNLFPLFVPFGRTITFDSTSTREFILCTKQFFVKKWKNNLYYCLPVSSYRSIGIVNVIPPEELNENIIGYKTPTAAMLDFYIHILEEVQLQQGVKHPECNVRKCEYNYGRKCWYEDIAHTNSEKCLCDKKNKEVI